MRFNTLNDWLEWQSGLHPNPIDLGLERLAVVHQRLGLPSSLSAATITVAGTNGKGSTVAYLENMARAAGYSTLVYTSPHLERYTERLRWCGREVTDEALWCDAFEQIDQARGEQTLTYFEFGTLAVLLMAQQLKPQVCILEVGLGGRLDAVNLISADVAIITSVDLDHCEWLGSTREEIGREKAGIARAGKPLIYAALNSPQSVVDYAHEIGAVLIRAGVDYTFCSVGVATDRILDNGTCVPDRWACVPVSGTWVLDAQSTPVSAPARWFLPPPLMLGSHQIENAAAALMALHCVGGRGIDRPSIGGLGAGKSVVGGLGAGKPVVGGGENGGRDGCLTVSEEALREAMATSLPGRCEVLPGPVMRILDVSHNPAAIAQLAEVVASFATDGKKVVVIFGMMRRKDLAAGIEMMSARVQTWIVPVCPDEDMYTAPEIVSALRVQIPASATIETVDSMTDALICASRKVAAGDILVVFGSFRMVEWYRQAMGASLNPEGTPLDTAGTPLDTEGTPLDTAGTPLDTAGTPLDTAGTPLDTAGTPLDTAGTPLDTEGTPLNSVGSSLSAAHNSLHHNE